MEEQVDEEEQEKEKEKKENEGKEEQEEQEKGREVRQFNFRVSLQACNLYGVWSCMGRMGKVKRAAASHYDYLSLQTTWWALDVGSRVK